MPTTTPIKMNVNEAKAKFSSLLAGVERTGQPVTILRYGHPVAQVVPMLPKNQPKPKRIFGCMKDKLKDFDWDAWEFTPEELDELFGEKRFAAKEKRLSK